MVVADTFPTHIFSLLSRRSEGCVSRLVADDEPPGAQVRDARHVPVQVQKVARTLPRLEELGDLGVPRHSGALHQVATHPGPPCFLLRGEPLLVFLVVAGARVIIILAEGVQVRGPVG